MLSVSLENKHLSVSVIFAGNNTEFNCVQEILQTFTICTVMEVFLLYSFVFRITEFHPHPLLQNSNKYTGQVFEHPVLSVACVIAAPCDKWHLAFVVYSLALHASVSLFGLHSVIDRDSTLCGDLYTVIQKMSPAFS